jgi:hypothetical protein
MVKVMVRLSLGGSGRRTGAPSSASRPRSRRCGRNPHFGERNDRGAYPGGVLDQRDGLVQAAQEVWPHRLGRTAGAANAAASPF